MFMQTSELGKILDDPGLIIIDSRSFGQYSGGHIPGAIHLDLFAFHWIDTTDGGIEAFNAQARQLFSFCGVTEKSKVVFYDDQSGMLASRGVWLLNYFSHPDAHLLDGGYGKWKKEAMPTETSTNSPRPAEFSGRADPEMIAGFEFIRDNLADLKILDARSPEEYDGRIVRAAKSGHIPRAVNIDWNLNLAEDGTIADSARLEKLYQFPKDAKIVTYCQGAYRAANTFLSLKKIGFKDVRVYLGSWGEWGNKPELAAET